MLQLACRSFLFGLALLLPVGGCSARLPPPPVETAREILDRACRYLWSRQGEDGGWHSKVHGLLRSGQALTPFVLHALLEATPQTTDRDPAGVAHAAGFIRRSVNCDGIIGLADPDLLEYPNYSTALALRCLVATGEEKDQETIEKICRYLQSQQFLENRGFSLDHPVYGAWGFGGPLPLGGSPGHVDISYTRHVLEALRDSDTIGPKIASGAQLFLERMQREGGFYFSPVVEAANKGETRRSEEGGDDFHLPYATATSEGLLALLASGADDDDSRVIAARGWLAEHPGLDHPGGIPRDHPEDWGRVLFYYHLAIRGEVAGSFGSGDRIIEPLSTLLAERQRDDGSFVNPHGTLMKEDCPILATALAVLALGGALSP